jgi:hypothetical protein
VLTVGELIDFAGRFYTSAGSNTVISDQNYRDRARYNLTTLCARAWMRAPWWFRQSPSSTVNALAGATPSVAVPTDFGHFGTEGHVFQVGQQLPPLKWIPADELLGLRNANITTTNRPTHYTLLGKTTSGLALLQIYPGLSSNTSFNLVGYVRKMVDLVDHPVMANVILSLVAGSLSGAYQYGLTFLWLGGETELSPLSAVVNPASRNVVLSAIPLSPAHTVTGRNIYRTTAGGGLSTMGLVATLADNITTTYTDSTPDLSLGLAPPTASSGSVTGLEQFPDDMVPAVFADGLIAAMARSQSDLREKGWRDEIDREIRRFWGEFKQGQNFTIAMPRYGSLSGFGGYYRRWRPVA